ncbi:MAG: trigger factor [Propionibacteriaceae bacterium]|nr:trigger factor [Propionibacteriaceae bacterium]
MTSTVERLSSTRVKLTIEVPFADLKPAIDKAYRTVAGQISIPGFRKGHVPPAVIDQRVGRGSVLSEAVNEVLPQVYAKAIDEQGLTPLGRPEVDMTKLEDGESAEFVAEVDVAPDFELPDFSSLTATVPAADDIDSGVDQRIETLRERFAEVEPVDRPSQVGDQVTINLSGFQEGQALADANAEGISYVIGSGQMLDGLDDAVTGLSAGDSAEFTSKLLGGEHAGQEADLKVEVTAVHSRSLPEVDDAFAAMVSQFDTVAEMRSDLAQGVERSNQLTQLSQARQQILDAAIAAAGFELPEQLVESEVAGRLSQINEQLKSSGMTLESYLERIGGDTPQTVEQFTADTRKTVERGIGSEILLDKVAATVEINVTQEDLTNMIFQKAQENGSTPEQELQHMQSHNHLPEWMGQIRQSKALDTIVTQATISDSNGQVVDLKPLLASLSAASVVDPELEEDELED